MRNNLLFALIVLAGFVLAIPPLRVAASGTLMATYNLVQDEGSNLTRRQTLNCVGAGITCADSGGKTTLTVTGAAAGTALVYSQTFTTQTSIAITHNLGTLNVVVQCYNGSSPAAWVDTDSITLTDANTATVTFAVAQTGKCVVVGG